MGKAKILITYCAITTAAPLNIHSSDLISSLSQVKISTLLAIFFLSVRQSPSIHKEVAENMQASRDKDTNSAVSIETSSIRNLIRKISVLISI